MTSRKACFIKTLGCLLFAAILFVAAGGSGWAAEPAESKVKELMPAAGGALVHAGQKDWSEVAKELEQFEAKWKALQAPTSALADGVTTALVEAKQALGEAQAKPDQAYQAVSKLTKAVDAFASAQEAAGTKGDGKAAAKSLPAGASAVPGCDRPEPVAQGAKRVQAVRCPVVQGRRRHPLG
ncbi:hypothetical protein LJK87_31770 [Paenibacillus sp. P25]|nr:hypothetical protein LJK87_31770 [Paenibacillus sp. P25]